MRLPVEVDILKDAALRSDLELGSNFTVAGNESARLIVRQEPVKYRGGFERGLAETDIAACVEVLNKTEVSSETELLASISRALG